MKKQVWCLLGLLLLLTGCGELIENEITVISREDGSGTRGAFVEILGILEKGDDGSRTDHTTVEAIIVSKTDVMLANVAGDPNAIGYVSLGSLNDHVKVVAVEGVYPSAEHIKDQSYLISRGFNVAYRKDENDYVKDFLSFVMSQHGQLIVEDDYVAVVDNPLGYQTSDLRGKLIISGSSSVAPVMERLVEEYLRLNPKMVIEIQTSDSTSGITTVVEGVADIAMVSRELTESELGQLDYTTIALDGIVIIVHPDNPIESLTMQEIKDIFMGNMVSWNELRD